MLLAVVEDKTSGSGGAAAGAEGGAAIGAVEPAAETLCAGSIKSIGLKKAAISNAVSSRVVSLSSTANLNNFEP